MKKPALFLTVLFISIVLSTALVSTLISGLCASFFKENTENAKAAPAGKPVNSDMKHATVKL